jgi:dTDP-4-amino-4,6-dideoxygalactose transaminase
MGALTPILYQGAIPVFADVDPRTGNVSAATIADRLSQRTRAIVVTHLFGNPCEMGPILELAGRHGLPVIEDCAQALGARYAGRHCGTLGAIGTFSLQQGKHITTGEGGLVATDDDALARRLFLFINKAWGYGDAQPDHYFLALNCRMSELQGAVGVAQLPKLAGVVERRVALAARLGERLQDLPGVETPWSSAAATPSYWKYALRVDPALVAGGPEALARLIAQGEIASAPRYIQKPAFRCRLFEEQRTFGASRWPFTLARPEAVDYRAELFPGTFTTLERILVLPWNERLSEAQVDRIARTLRESTLRLSQAERR